MNDTVGVSPIKRSQAELPVFANPSTGRSAPPPPMTIGCYPSVQNPSYYSYWNLVMNYYRRVDAACSGSVIYSIVVPIYKTCTKVGNYYGISTFSGNSLTQSLCTDSSCQKCQTSDQINYWLKSDTCAATTSQNGTPMYNTKSVLFVDGAVSSNTPGSSSTSPTPTPGSPNADAVSWQSVAIPTLVAVSVILAIVFLIGIVKYKISLQKKAVMERNTSRLNRLNASAPFVEQPTEIVSGLDHETYLLYMETLDKN
ncbi:hypothetical protein HDV01_000753 [Terramyces sp. JEL0728]|nr:hypothetical protein HDV01_000753 [Terramyces sp. JEL0728]